MKKFNLFIIFACIVNFINCGNPSGGDTKSLKEQAEDLKKEFEASKNKKKEDRTKEELDSLVNKYLDIKKKNRKKYDMYLANSIIQQIPKIINIIKNTPNGEEALKKALLEFNKKKKEIDEEHRKHYDTIANLLQAISNELYKMLDTDQNKKLSEGKKEIQKSSNEYKQDMQNKNINSMEKIKAALIEKGIQNPEEFMNENI